MAGVSTEEAGSGRSDELVSTGQHQQRCQSGEALAEWRSSGQIENGSSSTSTPYWDTDEDNDDGGQKPSELYGKYTWKIDKFSQINKRELRSDPFEVGGYKWYILIYPQGCDVCNHLSLFLCVANHDKLLPGWSHFAQFTISVVNKVLKKSKYSDTLHRFWKKEHDWGWKKFMELSKVLDGFIDADTLTIKAQVQVIRERADRPFRCLDCQYRRELVGVYLTNVEQICRRFVEERRTKLGKLLDDKARWSSFRSFWLGMDQSSRRRMSREKTQSILKVVVKHFFIEKEVTSTLVMDSLNSGLKSIKGVNKVKDVEADKLPIPIVGIEKDTFVLVDDVLLLLERAATEPLPPKDEKGSQNRTKDENAGEESIKNPFERDERRLTELGRRTIEIFVLAHIFSKIEVAYQEAVALKKQEELIREEEAAWLAEIEQKARRGAIYKEKKSKKKQGKQKKNKSKTKDREKDDKTFIEKIEEDNHTAEREEIAVDLKIVLDKPDRIEDGSDVTDSVDDIPETPLPDEDRSESPINWDTDSCEMHHSAEGVNVQNDTGRIQSAVDDCSSTCSSDSVHSVRSVPHKGNSPYHHSHNSQSRGRKHQGKVASGASDWVNKEPRPPSDASYSFNRAEIPSQAAKPLLDKIVNGTVHQMGKKEEEVRLSSRNFSAKVAVKVDTSPPRSPSNSPVLGKKQSSDSPKQAENSHTSENNAILKPLPLKFTTSKPAETPSAHKKQAASERLPSQEVISKPAERPSPHQKPTGNEKFASQEAPVMTTGKPSIPVMSRPLSAPIMPATRPAAQPPSILARSVSVAGRLGPETYAATSYTPQSYRNAMMGGSVSRSSSGYTQNHPSTSVVNTPLPFTQPPPPPFTPGLSFERMGHHDVMQGRTPWMDHPQRNDSTNLVNGMQSLDLMHSISQDHLPSEFPACTSGRQNHMLHDEFPHLDIINALLDDDLINDLLVNERGVASVNPDYHQLFNSGPHMNRHSSFPGDPGPPVNLYGAPGRSYDTIRGGSRPYGNGQGDSYMSSQWQMGASDPPLFRNMDNNGYPVYRMPPEYSHLGYRPNGL